jgi:hypothetical protein
MSIPDDSVAILSAREAIREVLHNYCRGLDRMDRPLAQSVWHPGGTADYGPGFRGTGSGFLDFVWEFHAGFRTHSHRVSNAIIRVDLPGGTAVSETYVSVWLQTSPEDGSVTDQFHRGRYIDRWSCRDGVWAIDHRTYVADLFREIRSAASAAGPANWGTRDSADPSYREFGTSA